MVAFPFLRRGNRARPQSPSRQKTTLWLEPLEERTVPATLPGSTFEIDGNLIVNGGTGAKDWASFSAPVLQIGIDKPSGAGDDSFTSAKETDLAPSISTGSIPNNKSDLTRFYVANESLGAQDFLYLAWERANTLGTVDIDFEFNQSGTPSSNGVTPVRMAGDMLITFDFTSGGSTVNLGLRQWQANGTWGPSVNLAGFAIGAVNDPGFGQTSVTDPFTGQLLPQDTFGEAAINLSLSGVFAPGKCLDFGSTFVKSRSSSSFTAEMKDFIAPISINVDNCSMSISESADALSKVGDPVTYAITVTNTGNLTLYRQSVTDTLLGNITSYFPTSLVSGQSAVVTITRIVQPGDPDPLPNTTTVVYNTLANLTGDTEVETASHSTNLFQPSVTIAESGPSVAQVGSTVTYHFTITNTSSSDSPNLVLASITDVASGWAGLGNLSAYANAAGAGSLAPGQSAGFDVTFTVSPGTPNPMQDTVNVLYHPSGFPDNITASASHSLATFQASLSLVETGTTLSKVGDPVTYTFTITNTSASGNANLILDSANDTLLGDLTSQFPASLAPGQQVVVTVTRTVTSSDPDPLNDTITVQYHVSGSTYVVTASASQSVNLFQPSVAIAETGPTQASVGDTVTYHFTITNTSSPDSPNLVLAGITDAGTGWAGLGDLSTANAGAGSLAPGQSVSFDVTHTVTLADPNLLNDTVNVLYHPSGFPNNITASNSHSITILQPNLVVTKTPDGATIQPGQTATFTITVSNTGLGRAINVVLDDTLPDGSLNWQVVGTPSGSGTLTNGTNGDPLHWNIGNLDAGSSFTIQVATLIPLNYLTIGGAGPGPGALGSNFEVDGNLVVNGSASSIRDWANASTLLGFANKPDRPSGQTDDSLSGKESNPVPSIGTGSIPNNKSDLTNFLFAQDIVNNNVFLYLGWIRANTLGTANIDFEFNQSTQLSSNGVTPVRTPGDMLISFDFPSGGTTVNLGLWIWQANGTWLATSLGSNAVGAVNDSAFGPQATNVVNPLNNNQLLAADTFGEAVINLSAATSSFGACEHFGYTWLKSRSSASFSSDLKDFIAPIPVNVNTCTTVTLNNQAFAQDANNTQIASDTGSISITNMPTASPMMAVSLASATLVSGPTVFTSPNSAPGSGNGQPAETPTRPSALHGAGTTARATLADHRPAGLSQAASQTAVLDLVFGDLDFLDDLSHGLRQRSH
jgi:uncharacterized repeat protein (TIGR01451 family)